MSKTKPAVPKTKVPEIKTTRLTKTQKDLLITRQNEANEDLQIIVGKYNVQLSRNLSRLIDDFKEELKIDTVNEDWRFDATTFTFTRTKSKEEKNE